MGTGGGMLNGISGSFRQLLVDPFASLRDVFQRSVAHLRNRLEEVLPGTLATARVAPEQPLMIDCGDAEQSKLILGKPGPGHEMCQAISNLPSERNDDQLHRRGVQRIPEL